MIYYELQEYLVHDSVISHNISYNVEYFMIHLVLQHMVNYSVYYVIQNLL